MARLQTCERCTASFVSVLKDPPKYCVECAVVLSALASEGAVEPVTPLKLTVNDRKFLHRLCIDSE